MRSLDGPEWLSILIVFEGLQPLPAGKLSVFVSESDGGAKVKDHVIIPAWTSRSEMKEE
jgi:hypothetical protein